jgi:hypothetical protein
MLSGAGIGMTMTSPSADAEPFEIVYSMRIWPSSEPWSVMRSVSWSRTETETPLLGSI